MVYHLVRTIAQMTVTGITFARGKRGMLGKQQVCPTRLLLQLPGNETLTAVQHRVHPWKTGTLQPYTPNLHLNRGDRERGSLEADHKRDGPENETHQALQQWYATFT